MSLTRAEKKFLKDELASAANMRVNEETLTPHERRFVKRAHEQMLSVHRPSWPDFLVNLNGRLVGVEVKGGQDWFSRNQRRTFDLLQESGVMDIYLWDANNPDQLTPWTKARKMKKPRMVQNY